MLSEKKLEKTPPKSFSSMKKKKNDPSPLFGHIYHVYVTDVNYDLRQRNIENWYVGYYYITNSN